MTYFHNDKIKFPLSKDAEYTKLVETFERIRDELLVAFKIILQKENWCRRALCRDAEGEQLFNPSDEKAVQWCLLGVIYKNEQWSQETLTFVTSYGIRKGINDLSRFNDQEGHKAVLMFLVGMLDILGVDVMVFDEEGKEVKLS